MPEPAVSVILCVRNGVPVLAEQLEALCAQDFRSPWELVLVDNGSSDGSAELARTYADRLPSLRIVEATEMASLAYARNVGAAAAQATMLAFCDADDAAAPQWLAQLTQACPPDGMVGGRLDYELLNTAQARRWRGFDQPMASLPVIAGHLPFAVGANFGCAKTVFDNVGGFDPQFVAAFDDVDFSWRVQESGAPLIWCPDAVMNYRLRPDLRSTWKQQYGYGQAEVALFAKHRARVRRQSARDVWAAYRALLLWSRKVPFDEDSRAEWGSLVAMRAGRLRGSARHRSLYP